MNNRIKQLPQHIASQIAAGEVVERPASVLKELLENSIDAGGNNISVTIKNGGISYINVTDDGKGIHKDDLSLAILQHATSKIISANDLIAITSLGFRGEALASIASVSRFEITSKPAEQKNAWKLVKFDFDNYSLEPSAYPNGTSITMRDLFFNTPARKHFLRSEKTESYHLEEVFKRISLANFNVGFKLINNTKTIYSLPIAKNQEEKFNRLAKVFGRSFGLKSHFLSNKNDNLEFYGWIEQPEHTKTQAMQQYFYINNRMIKDKLINHAIKSAFSVISGDSSKNPNYCLYLTLNPEDIDVNVHPTKHEVRFKNARLIHEFISNTIIKKLTNFNVDINSDFQKQKSALNIVGYGNRFKNNIIKDNEYNSANNELATNNEIIIADEAKKNFSLEPNLPKSLELKQYLPNNALLKTEPIMAAKKDSLILSKIHMALDANVEIDLLYLADNKVAFAILDAKPALVDLQEVVNQFLLLELMQEYKIYNRILKTSLPLSQNINNINLAKIDTDVKDCLENIGFDIEIILNKSCIVRAVPRIILNFNFSITDLVEHLFLLIHKGKSDIRLMLIEAMAEYIAHKVVLTDMEICKLLKKFISYADNNRSINTKKYPIKDLDLEDMREFIYAKQ